MGTFVIKTRSNGDYQFNLKAGNGEVILTSQGYSSKQRCETGIASVRANAPLDRRYQRLMSQSNEPYFNLVAGNGEVIGTSQMYSSTSARDHGIESVKVNAPSAGVVEE